MDAAQPTAEPAPPPLRPREELEPAVRMELTVELESPVANELRKELRAGIAVEVAAGGGLERSVTKHDAGREFSRPATGAAATAAPVLAEPFVTKRDVGRVFSPPATDAAPLHSRSRRNLP